MKKRVLLFADPNSIHTKKWLEGWSLLGYEGYISGLSSKKFDNELVFHTNIEVEGGNAKVFLKNIFNFKKVLNSINPTVINAHYLTSYGLITALIKRKKDTLVLSLHGTDVMQTMDRNIVYLMFAKFVFYRSDLLVSVSETMTNKILKYFPDLYNKIITQQYGIDTNFFDTFQVKNKDIDLLTNRGWVKNSNYEILLSLLNEMDDVTKNIIGYDDSLYSQNLKKQYPSLESSIKGILPYAESIALVARCKVFISLTTSDGTPLSLLEAMYLGAVPIVSDLETNREIIEDGVNGFIIPIDKLRLHETIKYVLALPDDKIEKIRTINKKIIKERFNMEKNFKKMDSLLR